MTFGGFPLRPSSVEEAERPAPAMSAFGKECESAQSSKVGLPISWCLSGVIVCQHMGSLRQVKRWPKNEGKGNRYCHASGNHYDVPFNQYRFGLAMWLCCKANRNEPGQSAE